MKKMIVMLIGLMGLWFISCQKDSSDMNPNAVNDDVSLETIASTAVRFSVESDSVTMHTCKGKLTEVAVADLQSVITAYISTNYPASEIKYAAKDDGGKTVVSIVLSDGTPKGLIFNADGTFRAELKRHAQQSILTEVMVSDLPSTITTYITTNYTGAEVKKAGTNADGQYFVGIVHDGKIKVLLFNADGSFNKELDKSWQGKGPKKH
jgi:hypothetical protein